MKGVVVQFPNGRIAAYLAQAVRISANGLWVYVAVSVHRSERCEIIEFVEC